LATCDEETRESSCCVAAKDMVKLARVEGQGNGGGRGRYRTILRIDARLATVCWTEDNWMERLSAGPISRFVAVRGRGVLGRQRGVCVTTNQSSPKASQNGCQSSMVLVDRTSRPEQTELEASQRSRPRSNRFLSKGPAASFSAEDSHVDDRRQLGHASRSSLELRLLRLPCSRCDLGCTASAAKPGGGRRMIAQPTH